MPRRMFGLLALIVSLTTVGCNAQRQIRYGEKIPSKADAFDATWKAFDDCGLEPKGEKADMRIVSHWDLDGVGGGSNFCLFPLMWAKYTAVITDQGVELEGDAYGWGLWLGLFENLPVRFPIGAVEDKIRTRLRDLPARKEEPAKAPAG